MYAPFVFQRGQIRQVYQHVAETTGEFIRCGTVGWARTTDLLFHRQRRRVDTGSLNCQSQEACHTQKPPRCCPRRLVPLRLRRGTVSSCARTQPVLALIWTQATFNEAVGCVASFSGQRSPILVTCDWRRCSSSQHCCPIRWKWQSAFSIEHTSIIISNQGQQLIHHNPDTRFETRIGDDFAEGGRGLAALKRAPGVLHARPSGARSEGPLPLHFEEHGSPAAHRLRRGLGRSDESLEYLRAAHAGRARVPVGELREAVRGLIAVVVAIRSPLQHPDARAGDCR